MKRKVIYLALGISAIVCFLAFKSPQNNGPKCVLVSAMNGKGDTEGFMITWGDGKVEKRKATIYGGMNPEGWIDNQSKLAVIVNELNEKGYHYVGSHTYIINAMVFEKN